jgi:hypothetical protein
MDKSRRIMKFKFTSICLIFIISIVFITTANSQTEMKNSVCGLLYFPSQKSDTIVEIDDILDDFRNNWYSKRLAYMNEPIFLDKTDKDLHIFRFTHIGLRTNPFAIRVELIDSTAVVYYKQTDGNGDEYERPFIKEIQKKLQISDWKILLSKVDEAHFWDMHTYREKVYNGIGCIPFDPAEWILEGFIGDKYHFVTRDSPECNNELIYIELCNMFSDLFSATEKALSPKKDPHLVNLRLKK